MLGSKIFGGVIAGCLGAVLLAGPTAGAGLVVHEWGTFTALQDDDGTAIGAINADDEPVPDFVYRTGFVSVADARSQLTPNLRDGKGVTPCHPGITMRLETPVIYFYPPEGEPSRTVSVCVTFNGGWLTEFYPEAAVDAPDLTNATTAHPPITRASRGSLFWDGVRLGGAAALTTPTDDPVWTAPRNVARAATVTVHAPNPQSEKAVDQTEKFLFYRGVGHLDSPLVAVHHHQNLRLFVDPKAIRPLAGSDTAFESSHIPAAWLVEIRPEDGLCAYSPVETMMDVEGSGGLRELAGEQTRFGDEFNAENLQHLRQLMQWELEEQGLFPDEAAAMLKTWELSYFKSPGRRIFYIMPRAWTDRVLPLSVSGDAAVTRVMIGRIELVTPAQRASLARIAAGPCPDLTAFTQQCTTAVGARYVAYNNARTEHPGVTMPPWKTPTLAEMKIPVPAIYQDYLDLGRFRDALLLREQQRRPTPALSAFIAGNGLPMRETTRQLTLSSFLPGNEHSR